MRIRFVLSCILFLFISNIIYSQTYVSGAVRGSWTLDKSPYIVVDSVIVNEGDILWIDRGVIVMFRYHPDPAKKSYIRAYGDITAWILWEDEDDIIFTSERDDSYGDFNKDGAATIPKPGDWGFIQLNSGHTEGIEAGFDGAHFKYGGGRNPDTISNPDFYPMFDVRTSRKDDYVGLGFYRCSFQYSKGTGMRLGIGDLNYCSINNCKNGLLLTSPIAKMSETAVINNEGFPFVIDGFDIPWEFKGSVYTHQFFSAYSNNNISGNGKNYVAIGGTIRTVYDTEGEESATTVLNLVNFGMPYFVHKSIEVKAVELKITGGNQVKFKYFADYAKKPGILCDPLSTFTVTPSGDPAVRTIFTSEYDHKYDAVLYKGKDPAPSAGDWGYIEAYDFNVDNCIFSYGGRFYSPFTKKIQADSSAVIRVRVSSDNSNVAWLSNNSFNNLYAHGILFMFEAKPSGYETSVYNSSFLLNKSAYGIKVLSQGFDPEQDVSAANNYWYGKLGPNNPLLNPAGNGCRVSDHVNFDPYLKESDDELELFSSVLMGTVKNLDGEILPGTMIKLPGKREKTVYSDAGGSFYIPNVYEGYGYELKAYKSRYHDTSLVNITVGPDTTLVFDLAMRERTIDYLVDTVSFNVNPKVSEVQVGGTAYRYYKIIDRKTHDPVYGAEVFVAGLVDTFYTNYKGIATIPISWDKVGAASSKKNYYISKVGSESLPYPPEMQMPFSVEVKPREYSKMWGGNLWLKEGISVVQFKQEAGASIGLQVEDHGSGEAPQNLVLERGFKAGAGINLSASAKAKLGPIEAGAEASVGVNLNAYMQDQFIFDYTRNDGEYALAKFIVLAGSAFQYLDSPLHRYLSCALLNNIPFVEDAHYSNSVGLNLQGQAGAGASLGLTLKDSDGKESPIGAELKGSAECEGNLDFLFTSYSDSDELDFKLSYAAEIGLGVNAGVGFDIAKLFGDDDEKEKNNTNNNTTTGDKDKKEENEFEIEIPELLSAGASGGIKYGASIEAVRGVASPYTSLGFMYGYKYSAGVQATPLFGAGVGQDREYHFNLDFHDAYIRSVVENCVQLATDLGNGDMSALNLDVSSLSGADIFQAPLNAFAEAQKINAMLFPPVPYSHSVTDLVDDGDLSVEISFGLGPVKANFGAGIEYTEANDYLLKSGVFFDWGLYPLQEYPYVEDNESYDVGIILQDILNQSGAFMWQQIKDQLIPPIFKKIPIWPFTLLKAGGPKAIPVGPDSRTSVLVVDTLHFQDSVFSYYWDWYGTEGISQKKSMMSANELKVLNHVRAMATEMHKLDYGIGGFYQFEPNGAIIADSAVLTINYFDEELAVLLPDGSEYQVRENDLRMYVEDKANHRWVYVGGKVDPVNNTVTARIDSLGTFTLAPYIPSGEIELSLSSDTIFVEAGNIIQVSTNEIFYNTGSRIGNGEEFNVFVTKGTVPQADANPDVEGLQLRSVSGRINFSFQSDSLSGVAYIKVESRKGDAAGITEVIVYESIKPEAPELKLAELNDYTVNLQWDPSEDIDVSYYLVNYGTRSGGPYNGTASVLGEASPVKTGTATTALLEGLYKDSVYYFTVSAVDRAGNISDYSNELTLSTAFNHRPVVYSRVFRIEPELAAGTVIDTMWAYDEDKDQELSFYFAESNTCTAFNLDPLSGILSVKDETQMDYWSTRIDTLIVNIGVKDDGPGALSDSCTVLVILNVDLGKRNYLRDDAEWFKAYPNPAKDRVTLSWSENMDTDGAFVEIINLQGRVVKREMLNGNMLSGTYEIDLKECTPGIYFVTMHTDKGKGVARIVVM